MTIARTIDLICDWLNAGVCQEVELKKPATDKEPTDINYDYQLVHPYAFPLYLPTKDNLPPNAECTFPSICVQLEYGTDTSNNREMNISLGFGAWTPGIHPKDWIIPEDGEDYDTETFKKSMEGWRDLWNFADRTITAIEQTTYIGQDESEKVEVMKDGMEFGPYKEEDSIPSFYPHWFGYFKFRVRSTLLRNNQDIINFL